MYHCYGKVMVENVKVYPIFRTINKIREGPELALVKDSSQKSKTEKNVDPRAVVLAKISTHPKRRPSGPELLPGRRHHPAGCRFGQNWLWSKTAAKSQKLKKT